MKVCISDLLFYVPKFFVRERLKFKMIVFTAAVPEIIHIYIIKHFLIS